MEEKPAELPVSPQEVQIQAPVPLAEASSEGGSFLEKLKLLKFKILAAFLGILVFVGAVFGAYKFGQRRVQPGPKPTPTPIVEATPTPDPTANWKTYTNTEYGYSIKFPPDWQQGIEIASFTKNGYSLTIGPGPLELSRPPHIIITTSKVKMGDRDYLKQTWKFPDGRIAFERIELDIEVEGSKFEIVLMYKDSIYSEEYDRTFNLILSTFRFLEEKEGAREKVYCKEPRPQVCTMECIQNPPYICGSDGKSYCSECQACSKPEVEWYVIQDEPCSIK